MIALLPDMTRSDLALLSSSATDWRVEIEKARLTSLVDPKQGLTRLREIGLTLPTREARVQFAKRAVEFDDDAQDWIRKGESGGLSYSEFAYWSCLQLYPFAADVVLRYAKVLLAQDKLVDAEVQLRHAVALGTSFVLVRPDLEKIALRRGETCVEVVPSKAAPGLTAPLNALSSPLGEAFLYPDLLTVNTFGRLFISRAPAIDVACRLMRTSRTAWDLLVNILPLEDFRTANLDMIYILSAPAQRKMLERARR